MNKIKFNSGIMTKGGEYYTLRLYDITGKRVYIATLDRLSAASIINKHSNINLI